MNGTAALIAVLQVLIVILALGGGWWLLNAATSFDDHYELWQRSNWGYLVQRVGFVAVQVIGVSSLVGQDLHSWNSLLWVGGGVVWATLLAILGFWITDWMILRTRATKLGELNAVPLSVGLVRLGFYLGLAMVVRATFIGHAPNLGTSLTSIGVFTVAGIAGLVIAFYLHSLVSYGNLRAEMAAGGVTEGLESAGVLTAVGLILYGAMAGDFTTWPESLAGFGIALGVAYVGLYVARYLIDWFVLTGSCTLKTIHAQQQRGAAALLAFLLVMVALPISAVVNLYIE
ncbi:hypothetical protein AB0M46_01920 [Dactylosporangium sp. NPDC051485]|uniref:DUF350 domain-containing protein n=1 Tax=Dactylosporangium sp. NPDC051485 TaxID=3154846 RepID=UPI0034331EFA